MTGSEQREAARQFINRWRGKGKEDEDGRSYWIELLSNVFGVENVTSFLVLLAIVRWNQILLFIRFI